MKAWILHNPNNMTYEETEKPQPKSDEVLVAVKERVSVVRIFPVPL